MKKKPDKKHLVIVGNGGAAINAVKGIRALDNNSAITLISKEAHVAYAPVLTTYLMAGKVDISKMMLVDQGFYKRNGVEYISSKMATSIDTSKCCVIMGDGESIGYDKLLIASGASPKGLDLDHPEGAPVFTLRTIEDAESIRDTIPDGGKMAFSGAGLVSLQTASALAEKLDRMTFFVGSEQVLSQNLDAESAAMVQKHFESIGADFLFGTKIVGVENRKKGAPVMVHTDDGKTIFVDAVVVGKGVRPNIPEMAPSGVIEVGSGIRVDERMETTAKGVFAAGDVCETRELISGEYRVVATWPNACTQGLVAGRNMAGGALSHEGSMPMNVTSLLGLSFASMGCIKSKDGRESASFRDDRRGVFKKWIFEGDCLVGAILLGDLGDITSVVPAIRTKRILTREKAAMMEDPGRAARILRAIP